MIAISMLLLLVNYDGDRGSKLRTARNIAKLQAGEQDFLIYPFAATLFSHANDEQVVRSLADLVLTGDLAPYTDAAILEFDQISKIDLYCTTNTDQFLALAAKFPNLVELYVNETDATDAGVISTSKCSSLTGFGITSWGNSLTMNSINELSNVSTVRQISLEIGSQPNDLSKLRKALPQCGIYERTY